MENNPKTNPGGDGETIQATEASGGRKTGHIRWVLGISTVLALVAVFFIAFVSRT